MAFVTNGTTQVWWDERGAGEPVLLAMGHAYDSRMWHRVVASLADRHRLLFFDNRGVGRTVWDGSPFGIPDLAADALRVLDAAGVQRAHVYGVSMGGLTAQEIALSAPDRTQSLVLGCTGTLAPDLPTPQPRRRDAWKGRLVPRRLVLRMLPAMAYGPGTPHDIIAEDRRIIASTRGGHAGRLAQGHAVAGYRSRDRLGSISNPTLVLHGDADRIVPWDLGRELADLIPGAEFVTLTGKGHNYIDAIDCDGNRLVADFFAQHAGVATQATEGSTILPSAR